MLTNPCFTTEVALTVPFHDVDMLGVVWHGNYFRYFEIAREALLNQFDYGYRQMKDSGYLWPVVDTRVQYRDVLTFEQRFRVRARLEEYENRLRIGYQIFDATTGKRTTTGYTIQVALEEKSREMCFVSPPVLFERMGIKIIVSSHSFNPQHDDAGNGAAPHRSPPSWRPGRDA